MKKSLITTVCVLVLLFSQGCTDQQQQDIKNAGDAASKVADAIDDASSKLESVKRDGASMKLAAARGLKKAYGFIGYAEDYVKFQLSFQCMLPNAKALQKYQSSLIPCDKAGSSNATCQTHIFDNTKFLWSIQDKLITQFKFDNDTNIDCLKNSLELYRYTKIMIGRLPTAQNRAFMQSLSTKHINYRTLTRAWDKYTSNYKTPSR